MMNKLLCKLLAHNICCAIAAWYELGSEPVFGAARTTKGPDVLRFGRPG